MTPLYHYLTVQATTRSVDAISVKNPLPLWDAQARRAAFPLRGMDPAHTAWLFAAVRERLARADLQCAHPLGSPQVPSTLALDIRLLIAGASHAQHTPVPAAVYINDGMGVLA